MRIFVAVKLPQKTRDNLKRSADQFSQFALSGSFVPKENYHITLHFLGEVAPSDLIYVQSAMDSVKDLPAPRLAAQQFVTLRGSDVVAAKFRKSAELAELHERLGSKLEQNGFNVEHRAYRPHVTLLRKPSFSLPFSEVTKNVDVYNMPFFAEEIVLYESIFEKGGVRYEDLYKITLQKHEE